MQTDFAKPDPIRELLSALSMGGYTTFAQQKVLRSDALGILRFNAEGAIIDANDIFLKITGYTAQEVQSHALTWRRLTPPDWIAESEKQMEQFARTGQVGPYEKEYFIADGTRRWMMFSGRDMGDGSIMEYCMDITEGKRREADERTLAALGAQMISTDGPRIIHESIIDAAVSLMRADFASIQILHLERGEAGELELMTNRGFSPSATEFWKYVNFGSTCSCGMALRGRSRVAIEDVEHSDAVNESHKRTYRETGIRSMQSTPLISRKGDVLGMISTHWGRPHRATENELRNFDVLVRLAADMLERNLAEKALRQNEAWLRAQKEALQSALNGEALEHSLEILSKGTVEYFGNLTRAAFFSATPAEAGLKHIVGMGADYSRVINGFKIGPDSLGCGLAAYSQVAAVTVDVREEPLWKSWLWLAEKFDYRGCWSFPLHTSLGKMLGTFAVYWREPRKATAQDLKFVDGLIDIAAIIVSRHIEATVRQQATASLAKAKEEAEAANIAKDNFLATLSHELRTPLTPVLATLSSWEVRRSFPVEFAEDLEIVRRNVEMEARLIDDLLDLTRIAKGKIALEIEVLDARKVLDAVITMYRHEIENKGISLSVNGSASNLRVRGDAGRLQQIFWNVLKNAVKFTPKGGRIDIQSRDNERGGVEIVMTDSGVGFNEVMMSRLFMPFEQETAGRYGGLGLGLAISKALLEAQHGMITAKSDGPGKGASFTITLPRVNGDAVPAAPQFAPFQENSVHSMCGAYRILLVEDHADTARVMARLLTGNGHTVTTANSVAECLRVLKEQEFDILLSDIGLPDGTGIDVIRAVRGLPTKRMPAIALSGFGMEEDVRRTLNAGFDGHLTKPVNFARLEQTIQSVGRAKSEV